MSEESLSKIRVLCVDDNEDSLFLLVRMLKNHGAIVASYLSSEEALLAMKEVKFDVIISDISMPTLDGYDLVHALRDFESKRGKSGTPTVAVSSDVNTPSPKRHFGDFQVYMPKPFDQKRLIHIIERLAEADGAAVIAGTLEGWEKWHTS